MKGAKDLKRYRRFTEQGRGNAKGLLLRKQQRISRSCARCIPRPPTLTRCKARPPPAAPDIMLPDVPRTRIHYACCHAESPAPAALCTPAPPRQNPLVSLT